MKTKATEVCIVYRFLPQWRVDFFNGFRAALAAENIHLRLLYGKNPPQRAQRTTPYRLKWGNEVDLDWATAVPNKLWNVGKYQMVWQSLTDEAADADLTIFMQESSLLSNYVAGLKRKARGKKVALWGHGLNHQEDLRSLPNRFKELYATRVDWWFAYTNSVAGRLVGMKYPAERITVVNNAIDTETLIAARREVRPAELQRLRGELGLGEGPIGIYCGGMYPDKRLGFLTEACEEIRKQIPSFEVLLVGTGCDAPLGQQFAERHQWAHYVGPKYGLDRVPYFMLSDVFLMPGVVGLAVLDCFALETPMVTTVNPHHGPEIEYLETGVDGIISENSMQAYVSAVLEVLRSQELRNVLRAGCRRKAPQLTVEKMVNNFARGVTKALAV
jgi:glycosyltransferase involved in cell wall biosynthesis